MPLEHHRFLTTVARPAPAAAWCGPRQAATPRPCTGSSDELSSEQKASITAVSIDIQPGRREGDPRRQSLTRRSRLDPFYGAARFQGDRRGPRRRVQPGTDDPLSRGGQVDQGRALQPAPRTPPTRPRDEFARLAEVVTTNKRMYRAFLLLGELRSSIGCRPTRPSTGSMPGSRWASRSKLRPFGGSPHNPTAQAGRARRR